VNLSRFNWSAAPEGATPVQKKNFINVQMDAVGVGLAFAAAPFLPVFLTRLGATNFQVSLLTSMPALTGLFLAIVAGQFLQSRRKIVPWFSTGRFLVILCYALTGALTWIVPRQQAVLTVLAIWAVATIPQTMVKVCFSVVMNAVAGPGGRYRLMSRRWSIMGLISAITVTVVGQILNRPSFPANYQLVFIGLAAGGFISFYFSSHIELPDAAPPPRTAGLSLRQRFTGYVNLIRGERAFISFTVKRFVYLSGAALAAPLFPLYYVREVQATDAWIGIITSIQTAITLMGYILWARQGKNRGSRFVLLWTTLGLAFYPALVASTRSVQLIALYAGLSGIFQAGLNLVFFDELMKTVPVEHSATFVSLAQSLQYVSAVGAPLLGTLLADHIGLGGALAASGLIRLAGFGLFAWGKEGSQQRERARVRSVRGSARRAQAADQTDP